MERARVRGVQRDGGRGVRLGTLEIADAKLGAASVAVRLAHPGVVHERLGVRGDGVGELAANEVFVPASFRGVRGRHLIHG